MILGSEKIIILSKANLVDDGINLDEIKNSIREDSIFKVSIVVGENNEDGFSKLLENLQENHETIQQVFIFFSPLYNIFLL